MLRLLPLSHDGRLRNRLHNALCYRTLPPKRQRLEHLPPLWALLASNQLDISCESIINQQNDVSWNNLSGKKHQFRGVLPYGILGGVIVDMEAAAIRVSHKICARTWDTVSWWFIDQLCLAEANPELLSWSFGLTGAQMQVEILPSYYPQWYGIIRLVARSSIVLWNLDITTRCGTKTLRWIAIQI